jgi:hypothetical protein
MKVFFLKCSVCGLSLSAERQDTAEYTALTVEPCEYCMTGKSNESYNRGAANGYDEGLQDGRTEADQVSRDIEAAVRGALEEGREEGYGEGLADGRRLGREEASSAAPEIEPPQKVEPRIEPSATGLYIVRHYDGFDRDWMDVSEPVDEQRAREIWMESTDGGTRNTSYNDIDYYAIFPSDTRMVYAEDQFQEDNQ